MPCEKEQKLFDVDLLAQVHPKNNIIINVKITISSVSMIIMIMMTRVQDKAAGKSKQSRHAPPAAVTEPGSWTEAPKGERPFGCPRGKHAFKGG